MTLAVLKAAPSVVPRRETVDVPEWGGAVIVRGLRASEVFAVVALRQQALRRVQQPVEADAADAAPALELTFDELQRYGLHVSHLLSLAVVTADGLACHSVDDWELVSQSHPEVYRRLQEVAERLSGMDIRAVAKNSPQSPSSDSGSGSASA